MTSLGTGYGSVGQARNSIGQVHSNTCTSIQTSLANVDRNNVLFITTIGLACIANAFEDAALYFVLTNGYFGTSNMAIASNAMAFIQGTGLEITIKEYRLDYDADQLRNVFYRTFHVKINPRN